MTKSVPTSLRLPADIDERLERLAAETNRSKSFYLRELVSTGLDRLEWEYSIVQRKEEIRAGRRATVPLEDIESEFELQNQAIDLDLLDQIR